MTADSPLLINLAPVGRRPTGIANYALNLVPALGIENSTLLLPKGLDLPTRYAHTSISIPNTLSPDDGKWGHLRRLIWTQRQFRLPHPTIPSPLFFSPLPEAPLFTSQRSVVMVHDLIPLRFPSWKSPLTPYFRYYVPQVLHQAQHILCNSQATADEVMQQFGIAAQKLTPIPLAHDARRFRPLGLPTQNYFLYIGRSDPHKNVPRIVEAFAQMPGRQDYELWIVGSTDSRYTPQLMQRADALGIRPQVKWLDYLSAQELPRILNQAIALVFPSLWEGFGLPVLEAMACGTPVITSNLSALPEVAGDAALLVDPHRVEAISTALQTVLNEGRSRLQAAGLQRVQQFSWEITGAQTTEILRQYL